ncbi:hypothetical protein [Mesorhizobium sp. M0684]|uniref:hypothetical protein n=1 Tax=Mesorhizobium sp. M0684 TaxID=2956986 RepID=UPI00333DC2A3
MLTEKPAPSPDRMPEFLGVELTIALDIDDYVARGNRCTVKRRNILSRLFTGVSRTVVTWSGDVIGGCANFSTSFDDARQLDRQEIKTLCSRIGLLLPVSETSQSPARPSQPATRNTWSSSSYH